MVEVPDGQVLPAVDLEVPAAQAENDAAHDAGRPHQGPAQDVAEVVEEQVPPVLGALDDPRVHVGADRQSVGSVDARLTQRVDAPGHAVGGEGHVPVQLNGLMGGAVGDAPQPGGLVAVEDRDVLAQRDLAHGLVQLGQIGVVRATLDVVELDRVKP